MAKLSQLLTLECMLDAYDSLNIKDSWIIEKQGVCVVELVDDTNATLKRLISSKTRLSCRNVLVANFETMTNTAHWLKSKLFIDLPKALGKALREKIVQMVDLLKALMVKIIDVDEFAKEFFERLKKRYWKGRTTDYELWKARQSKLTIERLTEYQAELTANMLIMGVLKFDEAPSGQEMEGVDMEKLRKKLKDGKVLPDGFEIECAKLRRYSHWEGDRFVIDYHLLRKYLYCMFGKLTSDQHIKMFEYDIQMIQIHEDIERLGKKGEMEEKEEMKEECEKLLVNDIFSDDLFTSNQQLLQLQTIISQSVGMGNQEKIDLSKGMEWYWLYQAIYDAGMFETCNNRENVVTVVGFVRQIAKWLPDIIDIDDEERIRNICKSMSAEQGNWMMNGKPVSLVDIEANKRRMTAMKPAKIERIICVAYNGLYTKLLALKQEI